MKKVRLMKLALIGLLMGMTQSAHAFDWADSSYGNAPATVAYTGTDDDKHQVFLYNVAQKKFLAFGGFWGTEAVLSDVGSTAYLKESNGSYGIVFSTSNAAALGYIYSRSVSTQNGVFSDAVQNSSDATVNGGIWTISPVGNNEYTISVSDDEGTYYLCYSATDKRSDIVSCTKTNGDNCKWKLITKANMKDQFGKVANVDYDNPIDATFYIRNYGFTRAAFEANNLSWSVSSGSWSTVETLAATTTTKNWKKYLSVTAMPFYYGNSLVQSYSKEGKEGTYDFSVTNYVALDYDKDITRADGTKGLSGANGEFYVIQNADLAYLPSDYTANGSNDTYYNLIYGAYFNAKITGDGTVSQTFTVDKAGWYEVSCQGFNTAGNTNATVFAKVTGATETRSDMSNTIQGLPEGVTYNMTSAGIAFAQKMYDNVVLFYVPEDHKEVTIGVKVTGAEADEYTEFDDFRLVYRGLPEYPILLDETKESTDYIVFPEAGKTATVVLKRTFSTAAGNQWNSIVLPFDLTGAQVKNYFGQNVKLAKLDKLTSSKIWYKSVDLSTAGMEAGKPYIIKCDPTLAQYTKGAITVAGDNVNTPGETLDADAEYIVIPQVALVKGEDGTLPLSTVTVGNDNAEITACGLYVQQNIPLVAGHHYYAYAKGILYHYSKELPADKPRETLPMKGFRVYFDWTAETTVSDAKLSCYLDGVEEQTIITAIEGVTTGEALTPANGRKGIFTLDGQQVRGTGDSVEGLHKGVYIVNGKKLVVK